MQADVHAWLDELGVAPTAPVEVVHDQPWSRVLRVPTAGGDLFLKQCAPVQAFEVPLTAALAARWPDRLPEVVAADDRRAWLLLRDGGVRLREHGLEPFPAALRLYAELQVAETAHVDEFLRLGVPDVRLPVLAAAYEPFFERDQGIEPEEVARLRELAPRYLELCAELAAFGLPDSIQHDDLHDGNVFVRDGRVAILDWGDSSVAQPLFAARKALRVARAAGVDPSLFRDAFLEPWTARAPQSRLLAAFELAETVGGFAYALQWERQLNAMPAEARPAYADYMPEQLRLLSRQLRGKEPGAA
ncbi:MAG: phosphotransferase [Gaiellaceae bacterium]